MTDIPEFTGNEDVLEYVQTDYGRVCITWFGVGLEFGGKFTSNTVLTVCARAYRIVPEDKRRGDVYWFADFNKFAWITWERMTRRYTNAVCHRMNLSTRSAVTLDDGDLYLGLGTYRDFWPSYIGISERVQMLTSAFFNINGLRLLELGCGTGHQLLGLAAYDVDVYGMELNPRLYTERHRLLEDRVKFGDALVDPWHVFSKGSFDVIIVSMLGFVDFCDVPEFLHGLHSLLPDSGALVLDVFKTPSSGTIRIPSSYHGAIRAAGFEPHITFSPPKQQLICKKVT